MSWESSRNDSEIKQSKRNSKISEWLKPEQEIKQDESNNTKYYIIAGILIACLSWYYWDEIRTVGPFVQDWFRRSRPGNDDNGTNNTGMDRGNIQSSIDNSHKASVEQRLQNIFNSELKSDVTQIDLVDNIASGSNVKLDNTPSDNSMNHYFRNPNKPIEQQLTGLREITGNHFTSESGSVIQEIDTFISYHENASFPKAVVGAGLYSLIRERLHRLSEVSESRYSQLIENDEINNKIEKFIELEKEVFANEDNSPIIDQNNLETQSNTYDEVALANLETENSWSDKATPSVHSPIQVENDLETQPINEQSVKPKYTFNDLLNSIKSRRDDSHVVGSPSNKLDNLIDNTDNLDDTDLLNKVEETFGEQVALSSEIKPEITTIELPNIGIDSASSSDNSMNQYFNKPEDVKSGLSNLLDSIRTRRDDSSVVGSPQISQLGLSPRLSPLNIKPSISNLLDDTTALFDDDDDDLITSNIDKGKEVVENLNSRLSNPWDNVKTNIQYGDSPNNIIVDLKYDSLWTRISKYRFIMNTGQIIDYDFFANGNITERTFDLSDKIETDNIENVDIKEIILLDLNYRGNTVWKNTNFYN